MLKLGAFLVAAAACVAAGVELDRRPWESGLELGSTAALWESKYPEGYAWASEVGRTHMHEGVWDTFASSVLGWPPFALLGALAASIFVLARLSAPSSVPTIGGLRTVARSAGVLCTGAALLLIGAGAVTEAESGYTVGQVWQLVHPESVATVQMPALLDGLLEWPAWVPVMVLGIVLLLVPQRKALPAGPTFILHAPMTAAAVPEERRVPADMKRTLEYLESLRGSRPSV
jgi:hypothetical protein